MKGIFNLSLLCLLGVFVIIIMAKTPMIRSFFGEGFTPQRVSMSQCPRGYKMYMYDGTAFCCNGTVNTNAPSTEKSCLLPVTHDGVGFCTLGADMKTTGGTAVPNCSSIIAENLTKQGKAICPPSKPNFCLANRCCTQTTPDGSDCSSMTAGSFCDVLDPSKRFTSTTDCNYLRMKEMDTCPVNTNKGDISVTSGALAGLTIYGCSTLNTTCYTDTVLAALKGMGKDTTGLTACSKPVLTPISTNVDLRPFYLKPPPPGGCPTGLVEVLKGPSDKVCGCSGKGQTMVDGKCECPRNKVLKPFIKKPTDPSWLGTTGACFCDETINEKIEDQQGYCVTGCQPGQIKKKNDMWGVNYEYCGF